MFLESRRSKEMVQPIEIYTDGSLKKTGALTFGGWAFVVMKDGREIYEASGGIHGTTNQRMELQAIVNALEYAQAKRRGPEKVIIYSDSAYAINCYLQEWYVNWQRNGWRTSTDKEVSNQDLWLKIIPYFDDFWYDFRKVKGHAGNLGNERCDELAQQEAEKLKRHWRGLKNV